jgi:hypothetical protein
VLAEKGNDVCRICHTALFIIYATIGKVMSALSGGSKNTFRYLIIAFAEGELGGMVHSHEFICCHDHLLFLRFIPDVRKAPEGC